MVKRSRAAPFTFCKDAFFTGTSNRSGKLALTLQISGHPHVWQRAGISIFSTMQLHHTKGIILRAVKYGEASLIVTAYTELFGVQSYIVNGVRASSRKGPGKAGLFQPASMLDMVVYHSDLKNLQRIREFRWGFLYKHLFFDVMKNAVALFMVELILKCVKQPEPNPELFYFIEDAFVHLDEADGSVLANYPLFFALHLTGFFGFRIQDSYSDTDCILDLREGVFVDHHPDHQQVLEGTYSYITSQLLRVRKPDELKEFPLNQDSRRDLLQAYLAFYSLHVSDFGHMRTLPVLQTILSA